MVIILGFPLYWMLSSSLQTEESIFSYPPSLIPTRGTFTFEPFMTIFTLREHVLGKWIANSIMVSTFSSVAAITLGLTGGYALSRFRFAGATVVGFLILLTQMLPGSLVITPIYMIMRDINLINNSAGLILTYVSFNLPFSIWLLKGFFDNIPVDLEEQALIDGCTRLSAMARITIPLILPGIVSTLLFAFISAWGEYVFALTLIDSLDKWTFSVGAASLKGEYMVHWNQIMAVSFVGTLPVFILFLFMQRYLLAGLTAGGVKG